MISLAKTKRGIYICPVFLSLCSEQGAYALMQAGRCFNQLGDYQKALYCYNQFLAKYKNSPWADDALVRAGVIHVGPLDNSAAGIVKTLRQRAVPSSTTNMFQTSTDGAWVKDIDSTESITLLGAGEMRIRGEDEPRLGYWRDGPFSHPLHIAENHKNFLQYRLLSCDWKTLGVVGWGWTADVYKNGETITTSGTIEGGMGHESNETPVTSPHIRDIPETSIPPID